MQTGLFLMDFIAFSDFDKINFALSNFKLIVKLVVQVVKVALPGQ